jgi:type IV pilus assembly protein PilO
MKLSKLNNIDLKTLGTAPAPVKGSIIALLCVLLVGGVYYFDSQKQLKQPKQAEVIEGELRQAFEAKQRMAANLDLYKAQLEEMRHTFGDMLGQLLSKTEIPA